MATLFQTKPSLLLLVILTLTPPSILSSPNPHFQTLPLPVTKDPLTSLYTLSLPNQAKLVLDLSSPLMWSPCPPNHPTLPCTSTTCTMAKSSPSPHCHHLLTKPNPKPNPNLNTNPNQTPCNCTTFPVNPVTGTCRLGDLTLTNLTVAPKITLTNFIASCAPKNLLTSLPVGSTGVAALSRSALSLPTQLAFALSIQPQFALCLPSAGANPGVISFGATTFGQNSLTYTPLVRNPVGSAGYYIKPNCITVNGEAVPFLSRVLEFDSIGHGGVELSTTAPYTVMRSHVYRPFIQTLARATRGLARAATVRPFGLCLKSGSGVGLGVPMWVDLVLPGGKNWTISGGNLVRGVGVGVDCFGFVDGGERMERAVVVGGLQMEGRLVVFDLGRSRLGLGDGTQCGGLM